MASGFDPERTKGNPFARSIARFWEYKGTFTETAVTTAKTNDRRKRKGFGLRHSDAKGCG